VTHQDKDHSGALASIYKYYRVKSLYSNQPQLVVNEQKFYAVKLAKNDVIRYDDIEYEVLNDDSFGSNENDNSLVGLWKYKDVSTGRQVKILLMGDVSSEVEERLVWRGALEKSTDGDIDVIKISHHGSDRATSKTLLDSVKPKRAVISVGKNNKFGHPSGRVQDDLMERSIKIDRTDIVGDVTVVY
jgi:competence protein ComEC